MTHSFSKLNICLKAGVLIMVIFIHTQSPYADDHSLTLLRPISLSERSNAEVSVKHRTSSFYSIGRVFFAPIRHIVVKRAYDQRIQPLTHIPFRKLPKATRQILFETGIDDMIVEMAATAGENARYLFSNYIPAFKELINVKGDHVRTRKNLIAKGTDLAQLVAITGPARYIFNDNCGPLIEAFGMDCLSEHWSDIMTGLTAICDNTSYGNRWEFINLFLVRYRILLAENNKSEELVHHLMFYSAIMKKYGLVAHLLIDHVYNGIQSGQIDITLNNDAVKKICAFGDHELSQVLGFLPPATGPQPTVTYAKNLDRLLSGDEGQIKMAIEELCGSAKAFLGEKPFAQRYKEVPDRSQALALTRKPIRNQVLCVYFLMQKGVAWKQSPKSTSDLVKKIIANAQLKKLSGGYFVEPNANGEFKFDTINFTHTGRLGFHRKRELHQLHAERIIAHEIGHNYLEQYYNIYDLCQMYPEVHTLDEFMADMVAYAYLQVTHGDDAVIACQDDEILAISALANEGQEQGAPRASHKFYQFLESIGPNRKLIDWNMLLERFQAALDEMIRREEKFTDLDFDKFVDPILHSVRLNIKDISQRATSELKLINQQI